MAPKRKPEPRRKRGTGTIQRQPDGSYIARTSGRERSGRFSDRQAAEEALELWNRQIGRGVDPNDSRQRLRDFIYTWLAEVVKPHCKPRTYEMYKQFVGYATAILGDTALEALTTQAIERCLASLRADLSPQSVEHVRAVLRNALNVAKRWKLITENPVTDVPKINVPQKGDTSLSPIQVAILLAAVEDDRLCALYHVALILGLRRGELLGLRWSDVDWLAGTITVAQQVSEGEGRKVGIVPYTKSDEIRLLPATTDLLARLRQRQALDEAEGRHVQKRATEKAGKEGKPTPIVRWNKDDLIFCSTTGTPIQPSNFNRRFAALIRRINADTRAQAKAEGWTRETLQAALLPDSLSPHDLRHTALTDLAANAEAKAVQSIAGHADIDTTMRIYAGRRMTAMRAAVEAVEKARKGKVG